MNINDVLEEISNTAMLKVYRGQKVQKKVVEITRKILIYLEQSIFQGANICVLLSNEKSSTS